jgi:hypothetical protein
MSEYKVRWRWEGESTVDANTLDAATGVVRDAIGSTELYGQGYNHTTTFQEPEIIGSTKDGREVRPQELFDDAT